MFNIIYKYIVNIFPEPYMVYVNTLILDYKDKFIIVVETPWEQFSGTLTLEILTFKHDRQLLRLRAFFYVTVLQWSHPRSIRIIPNVI